MKRIFDLLLGVVILVFLVAPMLLISIAVRLSSKGPALYWSDRVGKNNAIFKMPKFRSMRIDTPAVATHLLGNPDAYLSSNIIGTFNVIKIANKIKVKHLIIGSSSSVYGANKKIPFLETDKTDHQVSFYAATKKSAESLAHSYSSLWKLPITMLRFFTVYGPYGRPDMAYFKFTKNILSGKKIDIYNKGKMYRDYTYIDDIVGGIYKLLNKAPSTNSKKKFRNDSLSSVAPYRILNIGNTKKIYLLDFINTLEKELNKKIKRHFMPMQKGDVHSTLSDSSLLKRITGYNPKTNYKDGIKKFINWYLDYYS